MRDIYTIRLETKILLSSAAQCYHFGFTFEKAQPPALQAGQFLSLLAEDAGGKTYTRAYSLASAGPGHAFDLCVNRVTGGFFSNLLCDLEIGATLQCHGPHGLFVLQQPPANGLMIAAGTGIAPMRGFTQWLFPQAGQSEASDRSGGREFWLVYEAAAPDELYYHDYFQALASAHARFHYLPILSADGLGAKREQAIAGAVTELYAARGKAENPIAAQAAHFFPDYAYVCGLSAVVKPARAQLMALGWQKRQVLFERYD